MDADAEGLDALHELGTALVIGRFQPLHHGHAELLYQAQKNSERLIVGIGSADKYGTFDNPFDADERKAMIEALFPGEVARGRLYIVEIDDIDDPPNYVSHVEQTLMMLGMKPDTFLGNDDATADLFKAAGYRVESTGLIQREWLEGKTIRAMMAERDPEWQRLVPEPIRHVLESCRAEMRVQRLGSRRRASRR